MNLKTTSPPTGLFASKLQVVIVVRGCQVDVRDYAKMWRRVREAPPGSTFKESLRGWWPVTREELLEQFRDGMDDRLSSHMPGYKQGRKWDPDWQNETWRASRQLNQPNLVIDWLPPWLRPRFDHRTLRHLAERGLL